MTSQDLTHALDGRSAAESVGWAQATFGEKAVFANSFGAEDMVILDLLSKTPVATRNRIRVITLDTGRLFQETYDLMQEARDKYGIPIEIYFPDAAEVQQMTTAKGPNLFYDSVENRKMCCGVRKVHPLGRALDGAEAWIVGLRRDQSADRSGAEPISQDAMHAGIWKICPLADWTWDDVMAYVKENHVPINRLHAKNFPSIGCAPCTRAIAPGADPRSGRWWWELGAKECGLHPSLQPSTSATHPVASTH
jgi:phosphoadenosine phosphosulfate reductase